MLKRLTPREKFAMLVMTMRQRHNMLLVNSGGVSLRFPSKVQER